MNKFDSYMLSIADLTASMSKATRLKVGAVFSRDNRPLCTGWNGVLEGLPDDSCEELIDGQLVTKSTVIHAENALLVKCAREGVSMLGSTVYVTLSCCEHCASMLTSAGVKRVVYLNEYRNSTGVDVLKQCGIIVEKYIDTN